MRRKGSGAREGEGLILDREGGESVTRVARMV
jgi:hypothetical protein